MVNRQVYRGDDYWLDRRLMTFGVVDAELNPMDLTGCEVYSTWREAVIAPGDDPGNTTAPLAASITFDASGAVTASANLKLPDGGSASAGVLVLTATPETTAAFPVGTTLKGDVSVKDSAGHGPHTVKIVETITAEDTYTDETAP